MSRVFSALVLAMLLCLPSVGSAQPVAGETLPQKEVTELLERLEKNLRDLKTMHTGFTQEKHLAVLAQPVISKGFVAFERPKLVRFEIVSPYGSVVIANGRSVARYERWGEEWKKLSDAGSDIILEVTDQIAGWLAGEFRKSGETYEISARGGARSVIVLAPKEKGLRRMIAAIELEVAPSEKSVSWVTIREPGGDFTRLIFHDERRNLALPATTFETGAATPTPVVLGP